MLSINILRHAYELTLHDRRQRTISPDEEARLIRLLKLCVTHERKIRPPEEIKQIEQWIATLENSFMEYHGRGIMGYSTDFEGSFTLNIPLAPEHRQYLEQFKKTRRMKRDPQLAERLPDPIREAAGLPIGDEGGYFVGDKGDFGQKEDESVIDYNEPPTGQPSLWCQWIPSEDGTQIEWDEGMKFYFYCDWLEYLIEHFLKRWGYTLNGEVFWFGEYRNDLGKIVVVDNKVQAMRATITYITPIDSTERSFAYKGDRWSVRQIQERLQRSGLV